MYVFKPASTHQKAMTSNLREVLPSQVVSTCKALAWTSGFLRRLLW